MKPTEKVTNIVSQLLTYCKQGTKKLGTVTKISRNTWLAFFFKSMLLERIIKVFKPTNKNIWLKIRLIEKLPTLPVIYQHVVNKVLTTWTRLSKYPRTLELLSSPNLCYWKELWKFSNAQTRACDWKLSQLKSYQHIANTVPTICAKLPTYPEILDLTSSSNIGFGGIIKVHKPTNKSITWKLKKKKKKVANNASQLPIYCK